LTWRKGCTVAETNNVIDGNFKNSGPEIRKSLSNIFAISHIYATVIVGYIVSTAMQQKRTLPPGHSGLSEPSCFRG